MALPNIGSDPARFPGLGGWMFPYDGVYKGYVFYTTDRNNEIAKPIYDIYSPFQISFQISLHVPIECVHPYKLTHEFDYELTKQSNPEHVVIIRRHNPPQLGPFYYHAAGPETLAWNVRRKRINDIDAAWEPMVRTDHQPMVFLTSGDIWPHFVDANYQPLYVRTTMGGEERDRPPDVRRSARLIRREGR